ncbi:putative uncharacterized protein DDB_G0271606 [Melitaea cinxia]|uniref:putative uncharacterized protein DDB_G0271606 n=1 Tax=Melitaea cinxia TaxID=113334 RepID=UPI001E26FE3E|nr:putative uncharacterized protein DDB_G0271606 [Melitaea cinxia]
MVSTNQNSVTTEIHSEANVSTTKEVFDQNNNTHQDTKNKDDNKDLKKITKIPKLKQAVDKIKKEQASQEKPSNEPQVIKKIQSAIPRLKDTKKAQNTQTEINKNQNDQKEQQQQQQQQQQQLVQREESLKLDDEFDKLYEEIVEQDSSSSSIPTPVKFEELLKSDTQFEEIIHSYEDTKVQIVTEKVKSKIPLLKRKSEVEIEVLPTNRRSSLRKSLSSDDSTSKIALATKDKTTKVISNNKFKRSNSKSESNTENKSEIKVDSQTKFIRHNSTSESNIIENKSETVLESVITNVTKNKAK